MVLNKYPLSESSRVSPKGTYHLVVPPYHLNELFRLAVVSKRAQRLLETLPISSFALRLPAKILIYDHHVLVRNGYVSVRLPHTAEEKEYIETLAEPELWEVDDHDEVTGVTITGDTVSIEGGSPQEREAFELLWQNSRRNRSFLHNVWSVVREGFLGAVGGRKTRRGVAYPFPLFRDEFLSVFPGTKREALDMILERLRKRYEAKRDIKMVPATLVVTPNLDHLRFLFEQQHREFQSVYRHAFLQTADGYPPLILYGKASLGYQPKEQITGVDLLPQLINLIGSDNLPYTIYLIGGFGNVPYKTRDYFTSVYPNLRENFVGISTPPLGFLENKEVLDTILRDIQEKKPDIIFAGMTVPVQERLFYELLQRGINFGIGFGVGRAIEMVSGYQKREPAIVEKLHLSWIYRMLLGAKKEIKQRQRDRVAKDIRFVAKTLFSE